MEERMTLCNMSIEGGARVGYVNPDEKTFAYMKGRPYAPKGDDWDKRGCLLEVDRLRRRRDATTTSFASTPPRSLPP